MSASAKLYGLSVRRLLRLDAWLKTLLIDEADVARNSSDESSSSNSSDTSDEEEEEDAEDEEDDAPHAQSGPLKSSQMLSSRKRPRPRYANCINCRTEFDLTDNASGDCQWHPGDKEADYESDIWADHDERCHGTIEDLGDVYPEGFLWTCCDQPGDESGCETGPHEEDLSYKRTRLY